MSWKRKNNTVSLKDAIDSFLETSFLGQKYYETFVTSCWDRIVGPSIARHTTKIFLKEKVLYVRFDSPSLTHQIALSKDKLVELINKEVKKRVVKEIKII